MEFITVRQAAEKWTISERTVQQLCTQGRIPGAQKFGVSWAIPADAEKPADPRRARQQSPHPAQTIKYYRTINPRISSRPLKSGA